MCPCFPLPDLRQSQSAPLRATGWLHTIPTEGYGSCLSLPFDEYGYLPAKTTLTQTVVVQTKATKPTFCLAKCIPRLMRDPPFPPPPRRCFWRSKAEGIGYEDKRREGQHFSEREEDRELAQNGRHLLMTRTISPSYQFSSPLRSPALMMLFPVTDISLSMVRFSLSWSLALLSDGACHKGTHATFELLPFS